MNVLLVAECDKRALVETRRILDQFAERRGERTWQTPITQEGLETLHRLLRKSARKNTAVACHWLRGRDHSELLWIVGDASRFNTDGAVPTNTTRNNVLRRQDENDWRSGEDIRLIAAMAALFHDFGKANDFFQAKLRADRKLADPYRHEWLSLRLFAAFVGSDIGDDRDWLERLASLPDDGWPHWCERLGADARDQGPLASLPPLARGVGWLIVSHHRLPTPASGKPNVSDAVCERVWEAIDASWCGSQLSSTGSQAEQRKAIEDCWRFSKGLPDQSATWRARVRKLARRMLDRADLAGADWLRDNPYVAHLARLGLMLADHHYSSLPANAQDQAPDYLVYANTEQVEDGRRLKQRLDEHLIGVERNAHAIVHALTRLDRALPRIARHPPFRRRSADARFRWQDKAQDLAAGLQRRSECQGFFGINMASTGCGKTLGNARILYALADPQRGARFSVALGLRTLTMQTGKAYRERLGLGEDQLALLVGGAANRDLFAYQQTLEKRAEASGSASSEELLPSHSRVEFDGALDDGPLSRWLHSQSGRPGRSIRPLVEAPVLVCTIDHLMPACEATRGGHQIAPMLRLLTSDLVLDEPDDFDLNDLPALSRLVHMAGLLGSRVLLSSATLPPALVQGLFLAYAEGRAIYRRNRGEPGAPAGVCCAWFDEFSASASDHAADRVGDFAAVHAAFVEKRVERLARQEVRRRGIIAPVDIDAATPADVRKGLADLLHSRAIEMHAQHRVVDPDSGKRVSVGLIRMAIIDPLIDVAQALFATDAPAGYRLYLCVYHARFPLLLRAAIERRLDGALRRGHAPECRDPVFADESIAERLRRSPENDHLFLVLASPVAEVGRDHDYDWAIVEPSSMRSIIQLAGRIRRHRSGECATPNVLLLDRNRRAIERPREAAFVRPGFEHPGNSKLRLVSHRLSEVLADEEFTAIGAAPRILARPVLEPQQRLVDLEHTALSAVMLGEDGIGLKPVHRWWRTFSHYTGSEQQARPFRDDKRLVQQRLWLLPDEEGDAPAWRFVRRNDRGDEIAAGEWVETLRPPSFGERIEAWGHDGYADELLRLAEHDGTDPEAAARRYGWVDLPGDLGQSVQRWLYSPLLGFRRPRRRGE